MDPRDKPEDDDRAGSAFLPNTPTVIVIAGSSAAALIPVLAGCGPIGLHPTAREIAMHSSKRLINTAFDSYLRHGLIHPSAPTTLDLKQARTTTHYIWCTRRDGRVRSSHAENDGKVFTWDNPPPTGHPGEAPRCRCGAEPFNPSVSEHMQMDMSGIADATSRWSDVTFVNHYRYGGGNPVRLRDTGHLQRVVNAYSQQPLRRLLSQIADKAREDPGSSFTYTFEGVYQMTLIVFSLGNTTIGGFASGQTHLENGNQLFLSGRCGFFLNDRFERPLGYDVEVPLHTAYAITDQWLGHFSGTVNLDASQSGWRSHPRPQPSRGDRFRRRLE